LSKPPESVATANGPALRGYVWRREEEKIALTLVVPFRCSLVGELRVPARVSSLSVLPSPLSGRGGVHIVTFEACSSFTRVTACRVAPPPYVGFIARLRPGQFPGSGARKLPSSTNNLLGWVLPHW
jgi:hypothetical protein